MTRHYTIAASTIAALLLAVSPALAGDGKKAGGSVSTESSTSVTTETTETKIEPSVSGGVSTGGAVIPDSPSASPKMGDDKDTMDAGKKDSSPSASPSTDERKKDEGTSQEKK